ncbi:GNAT family N-acetyltransferase [Paracnuella aquatica]|uniref:GNAT family N-acetyltransferase n=1 Tax=Paracnuella aquatica TaxID=2268757 RepID=UPI000F4FBD51|nr:GNAT family N-acetyltransferase [Paracnuella aquatica]RPD45529.1 GNAT family N-acetyltransferase [Paracnuella aquatica]
MDYTVSIIDLKSEGIDGKITRLLNTTFGLRMSWEAIKANTYYDNSFAGSPSSFYVGAFKGSELVGFVAFKSHDFLVNGVVINCFHHCFVATASSMRGKGVFPSLLAFGKSHLKAMGKIGFVYGVPNQFSGPVFKKLNYKNLGYFSKVNVINTPILFSSAFREWHADDTLFSDTAFFQNDYQLIDAKQKSPGSNIIVFEDLGNLIWGKLRRKKKGGMSFNYFSVGGMIVNKPYFFKSTVKKLCKQHKVLVVQFLFHHTSMFKKLFKRPVLAIHSEPLVVDEVEISLPSEPIFNFMPGIKDHF